MVAWRGCRPPKPLAAISTDLRPQSRPVWGHITVGRAHGVAVNPGMLNSFGADGLYAAITRGQIFGLTPLPSPH